MHNLYFYKFNNTCIDLDILVVKFINRFNVNFSLLTEYNKEGFLAVQKEISLEIIKYHKTAQREVFNPPEIKMQRFPYPPWTEDDILVALQNFIGLLFVCCFLLFATNTIKALTQEKESQIKEAMKIMGLPNWLHWTAWFLKSFIMLFISIALIIVLLKVKVPNPEYAVLTLSDTGVLILLFFTYACASICLCFAVSVFFTQGKKKFTFKN